MSQPRPRPSWCRTKINSGSVAELRQTMGWAEPEFNQFRQYITSRAPEIGLNIDAGVDARDPAKFQELVNDCARMFPALKDFEGSWPVDFYFAKYTNIRSKYTRRSANGKGQASTAPSNSASTNSISVPKSSGSAQKSPKPEETADSEKENESAATPENPSQVTSQRIRPRPSWSRTQINCGSMTELRQIMGWAEPEFSQFREYITSRAPKIGLNIDAGVDAQDPATFQELVNDCTRMFPALQDFEGSWPVEFYFAKYTNIRSKYTRRSANGKGQASTAPSNSASTNSTSVPKSSGSAQKLPKPEEMTDSEKENESAATPENPSQVTSQRIGPRPSWSRTQINGGSMTELRQTMGWAEPEFNQFREYITSRAPKTGLNIDAGVDAQDPAKFQELVNDCTRMFPALQDFEGSWPVEFYFAKYTFHRYKETRRRANLKGQASTAPSDSASTNSTSVPKSSGSAQKSQKRKETADSEKENDSAPTPENSSQVTLQHVMVEASSHRATGPDRREPSSVTSITSSPLSSSTNSAPRTSPSVPNSMPRAVLSVCVFCGFRPRIPATEIVELYACLQGREDLQHLLAIAGIMTDNHLRALIQLRETQRHDFLSRLVPAHLNFLEKMQVLDMLHAYINGKTERPAKLRTTEIPRPPERVEDRLSLHQCKHTNVMKYMRIADEYEYFELVMFIEEKIEEFLDASKPIDEQDHKNIEALVRSVCEARPSLRRYEAVWPVPVHIRRFLGARMPETATGTQDSAAASQSIRPSSTDHECLRLQAHPAEDVPPSVTGLLAAHGMEELGPAFLYMGVRTDEAFSKIVTSRDAKSRFLARFSLLECSVFQTMMMRHILEQA
ncbi:hypothetical protein DFH07DRAFT_99160 [Mycena maculata]|uniref:Uncharacterized protein n=1 Tax=Mycena maculata TaxID=230809 RepID=A0AAD7I734_9AGAR|nr:hypothetical protein DFH07DRAFT_99160 [Mycena maculata]